MRLTHLIALLVAVPTSYTVYQKLNNPGPQSGQVLSELATMASLQSETKQSALPSTTQARPADWIQKLPVQAQGKYLQIRNSLRRDDRLQALRSWMALWNKHLRDPELAYVELDYIDFSIKNRSPVLYQEYGTNPQFDSDVAAVRMPNNSEVGAWKREFQLRLSALDWVENMLRVIRIRAPSNPEIAQMTGTFTGKVSTERTQLMQYKRYFDDSRLQ